MKKLTLRLAVVALTAMGLTAAAPSTADAQGYWYGNTRVVPYVTPFPAPPTNFYRSYVSPWGYQSYYNYGTYPTPWGFNTYQREIVRHRPIYSGPAHSVYWDPWANTYRYSTGIYNSPSYSYRYRVGW